MPKFKTKVPVENDTIETHRVISTVVARFLHTEDVTGSNPVSPIISAQKTIRDWFRWMG